MDIVGLLRVMVDKISIAFAFLAVNTMRVFEEAMRAPLHHVGLPDMLTTLLIVLIPASCMVVIGRWARGFIRFTLLAVFATMFLHAGWPLISVLLQDRGPEGLG